MPTLSKVDATLEEEHEALLSFIYLSPVGLIRSNFAGDVDMLNPLAVQLLMPLAGQLGVDNLFDSLGNVAPELRNLVSSHRAERGPVCEGRRISLGSTSEPAVVLSCTIIKVGADMLMTVLTDISRQVAAERQARQHESWLSGICASVNDFAYFTLDAFGHINSWNDSVDRLTEYSDSDVRGSMLDVFYAPDDNSVSLFPERIALTREEGWHVHENWCQSKRGRRFAAQILVAVLREDDGNFAGYSVVLRDVSDRRITSDELTRLLTIDHLTGALNRAQFFKVAEKEVARSIKRESALSFIMIDADHFKQINDTSGHLAGDQVLAELVTQVKRCLRPIDVIARLGGEEFCIMLPGTDAHGAGVVAQLIRQTVEDARIATLAGELAITISLGTASLDADNRSANQLLAAADKALYRAKANGRNRIEQ
jgi:diguanylate cyclase (GGDEF)-like protein/PAS domain S-box-containing protein